ncbi:MAG TPA: TRAP transporter large permease [Syntrophorhabdaceae bacterium]|nr:TRAP transporter large permease [Syntrophorhabdaceae bacterium]
MSVELIALFVTILLFVLFLLGLEIGFSMTIVGFIGFALIVSPQAAFNLLAQDFYRVFSTYTFTVIPLFVLMGLIGANAGISRDLYAAANKWVGHVPGGIAIGTIAAATLFKAICGSTNATAATFSTIAVPEMDRYGYDKRISTGTVATVGTLGNLIPPSVGMIIYGLITETSIGKLFLAGIMPGLIVASVFVLTLYVWCRMRPEVGPKGERWSWKERFLALRPIVFIGIIFVIVIGGLMMGYFSPSESASIGAFAVFVFVAIKREINFSKFVKAVKDSVRLGCMVLTLVAGATVCGHFFAVTKMPFLVSQWLGNLAAPGFVIIMIVLLVYIVGGTFIEDGAFFILATPIFFPIVRALGYDPVWFGVVVGTTMMIGVIIPPMAISVFIVSGITKVPINTVYKGVYPFLWGLIGCNLLFLFVPQISLWLPRLLMK